MSVVSARRHNKLLNMIKKIVCNIICHLIIIRRDQIHIKIFCLDSPDINIMGPRYLGT
jgi:hypothetical protein